MKLVQLTTYNIRNGGTSVTMINADNINTAVAGDVIQTEDGEMALVKLNFSSETIYIDQDDLRWIVEVSNPKPAPKPKPKPVPKPVPVPVPKVKAKAKPKVKKEKKNESISGV